MTIKSLELSWLFSIGRERFWQTTMEYNCFLWTTRESWTRERSKTCHFFVVVTRCLSEEQGAWSLQRVGNISEISAQVKRDTLVRVRPILQTRNLLGFTARHQVTLIDIGLPHSRLHDSRLCGPWMLQKSFKVRYILAYLMKHPQAQQFVHEFNSQFLM